MTKTIEIDTLKKREVDTLIQNILRLLRPKQWLKNGLVFAALLFSENLLEWPLFLKTLWGTLAFCMASSSVYVLNDIMDREKDRKHPKKCKRPIASGAVSVPMALVILGILLCATISLAFSLNNAFAVVLLCYLLINGAYSFGIKNIPILDLMFVAACYVMRALSGSFLINVSISPWLLLCTLMLALFLAIHKRIGEMKSCKDNPMGESRKVLKFYSAEMLRDMAATIDSATLICYCLYTLNQEKALLMMLTIPFVIFGIFRYQYIAHTNDLAETPDLVLYKDKPLLIDVALWVISCILIMYVL